MKDIITENLLIRESTFEDCRTFYEWELKPEVTEFFSIRDGQTEEEVYQKYLTDKQNPAFEQWTICLKETGEMIGRIVIGDIEPEWKAELWRIYIADTSLRGKGVGREAMLAVMRHAFVDLNLKRFYLDHYTGNPASYLYLSLGFKYEGVLRHNCRKNGILYDVHLMSMLIDEYEALYK